MTREPRSATAANHLQPNKGDISLDIRSRQEAESRGVCLVEGGQAGCCYLSASLEIWSFPQILQQSMFSQGRVNAVTPGRLLHLNDVMFNGFSQFLS
jgi:hypothetical protein